MNQTLDNAPALVPLVEDEPTSIAGYEVERILGRGGFGTVYAVTRGGERFGIKVLNPDVVSGGAVRHFLLEIEALRRVHHTNVIRLVDSGTLPDGRPYLVTEYLEGTDLQSHIAARGPLSPSEVRAILAPLCSALAFCHARGIVHRDIKASNVFLAAERVVLLDFGIAQLLDDAGIRTSERSIAGTPSCTSPEQLIGGLVDERTDVYLLGSLLYHLLTGSPPFGNETVPVIRAMHLSAPRPRPSDIVEVPRVLDQVVARAMSISPTDRYPGPRQLSRALEAALSCDLGAAAEEAEALGVLIEASAAGEDDRSLEVAESAVDQATSLLVAAGFTSAFRTGNVALLVGPLDCSPVDAADDATAALHRMAPHSLAALSVRMRVGRVAVEGGQIRGGPLLETSSWWES